MDGEDSTFQRGGCWPVVELSFFSNVPLSFSVLTVYQKKGCVPDYFDSILSSMFRFPRGFPFSIRALVYSFILPGSSENGTKARVVQGRGAAAGGLRRKDELVCWVGKFYLLMCVLFFSSRVFMEQKLGILCCTFHPVFYHHVREFGLKNYM